MNNNEINKLIAEKVMGWELTKLDVVDAWIDKEGKWTLKQMWKPTTDIRDAWEVINHFVEQGIYFSIHKWVDGGYVVKIESIELKDSLQQLEIGEDKSVPLAICKAALKVYGIEVVE